MTPLKNPTRIATACLALIFSPAHTMAKPESVAEFSQKESKKLGWRIVNDEVMGGLSQGNIEISETGILTFSGELSLENNGGFSSLRSENLSLDLSKAKGFSIKVKGDGRTYQLRLNTEARYQGMAVSFMAPFPSEKGKWTEVNIPFSAFKGSFRGRALKDKTFDPAQVRRIGIMLADKKPGSFKIQVDWIRIYGSNTTPHFKRDK